MKHASECRCRPCRGELVDKLIENVDDPMAKLALAIAGLQSGNDPYGQVIVPMPSMFLVRSPKGHPTQDGYMVALFMALNESEARDLGWAYFTEHGRPDDEWKLYHSDKSELEVIELGQQYFGSDGEGNFEL